jgi:transcriptional regulator with XRE-family HTH domain
MAQSRKNTIAPLDSLRAILRDKRKELNLTQEQLSFLTGYDRTYINRVERGSRNPSFTAILNICSVLRVSPSALMHVVERESGFEFISAEQLAVGLVKRKRVTQYKR